MLLPLGRPAAPPTGRTAACSVRNVCHTMPLCNTFTHEGHFIGRSRPLEAPHVVVGVPPPRHISACRRHRSRPAREPHGGDLTVDLPESGAARRIQ